MVVYLGQGTEFVVGDCVPPQVPKLVVSVSCFPPPFKHVLMKFSFFFVITLLFLLFAELGIELKACKC